MATSERAGYVSAADDDPIRRRLATATIDTAVLAHIIRLPEGLDIRGAHADYRFDGIGLVIQGAIFPVAPDGVELPVVSLQFHSCESCGGPVFDQIVSGPLAMRYSW